MAGGKTEILGSGLALTSAWTYTPKFDTLGFAKTSIMLEAIRLGSGVQYTVRGYPIAGFSKYHAISSGTILVSGASHLITMSDPYQEMVIGLRNLVGNQSGVVTVYRTSKRR